MNKMKATTRKFVFCAIIAGTVLPLTACNNNDKADSNNAQTDNNKAQKAVVATIAADFSSGAHAVFSTEDPYTGLTQLSPTSSDITVTCYGEDIFRIERFSGENVTRFNIANPSQVLAQLSTKDSSGQETASSNPQGLVFVSPTKAYLLRYGSSKAWIVNPSATTDAEFKIGELDLSAYNVDGTPNMSDGVIVDGKLYIVMQRMTKSFVPQTAYVAVFDTETDKEVDTAPNKDGLKGIRLPVKNPGDIEYLADTGLIYVQGTGRYASFDGSEPTEFSGGIASIDPLNKYATQMVLDDGDATSHPVGQITGMEITSPTKGYIIGYAGFNDNALYSFNPSTGKLDLDSDKKPVAVAGIKGVGIGGLAKDKKGKLWVSIDDNNNPGMEVLNSKDGKVIKDHIPTVLNPSTITFCDAPKSQS